MIVKSAHITSAESKTFCEKMLEAINMFQKEGLTVEVQYRPVNTKVEYDCIVYTAFVIGREKGE